MNALPLRLHPLSCILVLIAILLTSLPVYSYAQEGLEKGPQGSAQADNRYLQAKAAFETGDVEKAIAGFEELYDLYSIKKDTLKTIDVLLRLARSYQFLGNYPESLKRLESAETLSQGVDPATRASILEGRGQQYALTGAPDKAIEYFTQALSLSKEAGRPQLIADILNNYANLLASQKRFPDAVSAYEEGITQAQKAKALNISVIAAVNLSRLYVNIGRLDEAKKHLREALKEIPYTADTMSKVYNLIAIGRLFDQVYLASEKRDVSLVHSAFDSLKRAVTIAQQFPNQRPSSYALGYLAGLYEQERQYEGALSLTNRAIFAATESNTIESLYRWYWQKGRVLKAQGNLDESIVAYRQAVKSLGAIRQDLSADCIKRSRLSFRTTVGPVYLELADVLLTRSRSKQAGNDLIEARTTIEQLKGGELQDYFQDDCVVALKTKTKNLDQIIQRAAVIYFVLLPTRIELLVSTPSGLRQYTVPVTLESLYTEANKLRSSLENPSAHSYREPARRLYGWLIQPLEDTLRKEGITTLILVPDGILRTIPMAVLQDGERFLIDHYAIVTTPGVTLTDPQPFSREHPKLLLAGLSESVQGFPALPSVTTELQTIQKLYDSVLFIDQTFNVANIEKTMRSTPYNIIHIASHGKFDNDPSKTFLLTHDGRLSIDQLEKLMGLGRSAEKPVDLLTLSACHTAVGDDRAALGLAGVCVKAGARSALASLWAVNDEATSRLMSEFYRQLANADNSKVEALRKAQKKLMGDKQFNHPAYWAPFILIGNWL